jgi:TIR domain
MAFRHACFLSYRHGQHALKRKFIVAFQQALAGELELLRNESVYVDYERLDGGTFFNQALSQALYESVCMVMIYQPNYFDLLHPYCAREYLGMISLERSRRLLADDQFGLIIPVVLRGFDSLPLEIREQRQCEDFSTFLLYEEDLARHPDYASRIRRLAQYIHARCSLYEHIQGTFDMPQSFTFPSEENVVNWIRENVRREPILPGRE